MQVPSHADAFEMLCLRAAGDGRGPVLFGACLEQARTQLRPFMVGPTFPGVYLEFPLMGDPFLDVTVLYGSLEASTSIDSPAATGTGPMLDWFATSCQGLTDVNCGFELDVKDASRPLAAIHFQPRSHVELVAPFCKAAGIAQSAPLYLGLGKRMPRGWALSFFGAFRGRPDSPLRVCGYLGDKERQACARDPQHIAHVFETIGFEAYDDALLAQASKLLAASPGTADFQFDVFPDGTLGPTFAIDASFRVQRPELVRASFATGPCANIMALLESWGASDDRWRLGVQATFARGAPVELCDGTKRSYRFVLMPQWVKARWTRSQLQPAKLYHLGSAGLLGT